ncbi:MAG: glycosyltransferase [Holosporaceae bacterium]|nr:glycosyltransferase [Holosporaceae bacterium]
MPNSVAPKPFADKRRASPEGKCPPKPLISVIIPVYNVERYLRDCLDSVLNQSFKNIEAICVNDASPDRCPEILKEYARKDKRIRIINHPKNVGPAAARNSGLNVIRGDYVGFVDSDDCIHPDMYKILYAEIQKGDRDFVFCSLRFLSDDAKPPFSPITRYGCRERTRENFAERFDNGVCRSLYKRTFIDKMRFDESLVIVDDYYFNLCITKFVKKFAEVRVPLYYYRLSEKSVWRSSFSREKADSICKVLERIQNSPELMLNEKEKLTANIRMSEDLIKESLKASFGVFWYTFVKLSRLYSDGKTDRKTVDLRLDLLGESPVAKAIRLAFRILTGIHGIFGRFAE